MAADSDGDALPNRWEMRQTPQGLNLKPLGAKPRHKDVFLELDYSSAGVRNQVGCSMLNDLVDVLPATQPEWPLLDYSSGGVIGPQ